MIRATALALLIGLAGCGGRAAFTRVEFRAPSQPDPVLRPFLADVDHIGVVCATNIEPFRELDIEKVMARLSNAVVRSLGNMPKTEVMNQDEITYQLKDIRLDSTSVHQDSVQAVLRKELELDALVFVELRHLQARMMPMSPTPYGMSPNPGIDLTIDLKVSLINFNTNQVWQQGGMQRNYQPVQLQLLGGNKQGERQLLMALARPLQRFLFRIAPPPKPQTRHFDLGGD
ncbi:MAG: hypothetical protein OXE49_07920 [Gemmatimonadetes bacterium]|nr:hypothetical protein [Gemmatimonadota bacterium]